MAVAREVYQSRAVSHEEASAARAERVFLVDTTPDLAESAVGLPTRGSSFLFGGLSLVARSVDCQATEVPSLTRVVVKYDNDGSFRGPGLVDDRNPSFKTYEISVVRTVEDIPAFKARYVQTRPNEYERLYEREDIKQDNYEVNLQVRQNVSNWTISEIGLVCRQVNRIHEFGGLLWRYVGGDAVLEEPGRWHLTHNWVHDPGTIPPDYDLINQTFGGDVIPPRVERKSFSQWFVEPRKTVTGVPVIKTIPPFNLDKNGYQYLPGSPI